MTKKPVRYYLTASFIPPEKNNKRVFKMIYQWFILPFHMVAKPAFVLEQFSPLSLFTRY